MNVDLTRFGIRLHRASALSSAAPLAFFLLAAPAMAQTGLPAAGATTGTAPPEATGAPVGTPDANWQAAGAEQAGGDQNADIVVVGVRGAQRAAVERKRASAQIVDSIVAEDIGKLPDTTIADSLQRVPGIQIGRSAGEGSTVNIRGLSQALVTINGESFLGGSRSTGRSPTSPTSRRRSFRASTSTSRPARGSSRVASVASSTCGRDGPSTWSRG